MKIHQLLGGVSIAITNEERKFISSHGDNVSLHSLNERDIWIAQNLVRKDVYKLTNDNDRIVINKGYEHNKSTL